MIYNKIMLNSSCMFPLRNFHPEGVATAASFMKGNYIKSEEKQSEEKLSLCNFTVSRLWLG